MAIDRNELHQTRFDDVVSADEECDSPISPGEILRDEFLEPLGLSAAALARALHVPANRMTALINGQRSVSADTALRLARHFGATPELHAWVDRRPIRNCAPSIVNQLATGTDGIYHGMYHTEIFRWTA